MNTLSASPAETPREAAAPARAATLRILVWDVPVRVFHWLTVACFAGAWLTAESERWRLLHVSLGLTMAALVAFRLVWGLVGTRYARFGSFVRGPRAVARYLGSLASGRPEHHVGHNPAGGWAVIALLALAGVVTAAGWATFQDLGGDWLEDLHEGAAEAMLALVGLHVGAVLVSSWLHRENLVRAMVTGHKRGAPSEAIGSPWRTVGVLVLLLALGAGVASWTLQAPAVQAAAAAGGERQHDEDEDD